VRPKASAGIKTRACPNGSWSPSAEAAAVAISTFPSVARDSQLTQIAAVRGDLANSAKPDSSRWSRSPRSRRYSSVAAASSNAAPSTSAIADHSESQPRAAARMTSIANGSTRNSEIPPHTPVIAQIARAPGSVRTSSTIRQGLPSFGGAKQAAP
jgi:hypothetical protein